MSNNYYTGTGSLNHRINDEDKRSFMGQGMAMDFPGQPGSVVGFNNFVYSISDASMLDQISNPPNDLNEISWNRPASTQRIESNDNTSNYTYSSNQRLEDVHQNHQNHHSHESQQQQPLFTFLSSYPGHNEGGSSSKSNTISVIPLKDGDESVTRFRKRSPRRPDTPMPKLLDLSDLADILESTSTPASSPSNPNQVSPATKEFKPYRPLKRYFHRNRRATLPYNHISDFDYDSDDDRDGYGDDESTPDIDTYDSKTRKHALQQPYNTPTYNYVNAFDTLIQLKDALPDLGLSPTPQPNPIPTTSMVTSMVTTKSEPDLLKLLASYTEQLLKTHLEEAITTSYGMTTAKPETPKLHRSVSAEAVPTFRRNRRGGICVPTTMIHRNGLDCRRHR